VPVLLRCWPRPSKHKNAQAHTLGFPCDVQETVLAQTMCASPSLQPLSGAIVRAFRHASALDHADPIARAALGRWDAHAFWTLALHAPRRGDPTRAPPHARWSGVSRPSVMDCAG
jgi:hypothetical protein